MDLGKLRVWVYLPVDDEWEPLHKTDDTGRPKWVVLGRKAQRVLAPFLDRPADSPCFSPREAAAGWLADRAAARTTPA